MTEPSKKSADGFAPIVPPGNGRQGPSLLEASLASVANLSPATLLPAARREQMLVAIYRLFHAGSATDKAAVEGALMTFFAVHGTSDKTPWAQYPHKIVANGVSVPPNDVVQIIGQGSLKQFLGPYTGVVTQLYEQSAEFRAMMRERVTRAGLAEINGALAIDYVGKDGSLDPASTRLRQVAKNRLLRGSVPLEVLEQSEPPVAREVTGSQTPRQTSNDPFL